MSNKPLSATLKCSSCGHENEPERVYCHNCGSKLDRSLLPKSEAQKGESAEEAQRRVKKMMNPRRAGAGFNHVKIGVQVVVFAVLVSSVYLIWQKPDEVPDARKDYLPALDPGDLWEKLMQVQTANAITLPEDDLNYHISRNIKASEGAAGIKFVRAAVDLKPGIVTVFVERDAWGLPLYSSASYRPVVKNGKVSGEMIDTRIGRLGIHPAAPEFFSSWAVSGIWKAFEKEIKQSDRLSEIKVEDSRVQFISKPL
jgi:hypothetical protein